MNYYVEIEKSKYISTINPDIASLYTDDRQYNYFIDKDISISK